MTAWYTSDEFGLAFNRAPNHAEAKVLTQEVAYKNRMSPIEIGDLLNELEEVFEGDWTQYLVYFPEQQSATLSNYKSITKSVPRSIRVAVKGEYPLYISDMGVVRSLPDNEKIKYLLLKTRQGWTSEEIHEQIRKDRGIEDVERDEFSCLLLETFSRLDKLMAIAPPDKKDYLKVAREALDECKTSK